MQTDVFNKLESFEYIRMKTELENTMSDVKISIEYGSVKRCL